jgi:D-aminopeptidase
VLAGGTVYGLDAASGVVNALRKAQRGFAAGGVHVPIVPAAILFDLANGGDKNWTSSPYPALGQAAFEGAGMDFALGSDGAGTGATTAGLRGGLGSASWVLDCGATVGALVAVNALGSACVGDGPHFWAAPFEYEAEFGGLGAARHYPVTLPAITKLTARDGARPSGADPSRPSGATTIAVVATDAPLDQAQLTRMATAAHDGIARALVPAHTLYDGDLVFAVSTGQGKASVDPLEIGHAAATCLARAIARAVHSASDDPRAPVPSWSARFDQA